MDLERDIIQQQVYPRLNKLARQHGQSISFCDLRWGIDTSLLESESGSRKVLDVCLDEIDRCQPPMVVILGYRYGWIPSASLVQATAQRYSLELDDLEKSVTALEIEYGALAGPARLNNTLFYFREITGMPPADFLPEDDAHTARLEALKSRIRRLTGGRVRTYTLGWEQDGFTGGDVFADILCRDLEQILQPQWAQYDAMTPFQRELQTHENYLLEKAEAFRARQALAAQVLQSIRAGQTLTILSGPVGSGKSTLLSHIACQLQHEGWHAFTLFSNLTTQTGTAIELLKLTVAYLEQELGLEPFTQQTRQEQNLGSADLDQLKTLVGTEDHTQQFGTKQWQQRLDQLCTLYSKSGRKLVILVDAVDQLFPDVSRDELVFLPSALGKNVRFVMTCLPQINVKGNPVIPIEPIDQQDKEQVILGILQSHNRELSRQVIEAMISLPGSDNPLYLSFLVQRLMMMNKQDFDAIRSQGDGMDAIIDHQLSLLGTCPHQLDAMSVALMDTAAQRIGSSMVGDVLNFLALAPHGLRSNDLAALLGDTFNMLDFAHFISYMNDCFVIRSDGRYDFSHKSIREGLLSRCENQTELHRKLLAHFIALDPEDDVRRQEIVYHCIYADDKAYFVEYIQDRMWEDEAAIDYAAKITYAANLRDNGQWLCQVLEQGISLGAKRYLVQFIYKFYDRQTSTRAGELDMQFRIHLRNYKLSNAIGKADQSRRNWQAAGYALEALADVKEAMGTESDILFAQTCRKEQLKVAETLHKLFDDNRSARFLARAHERLAANMQLSEDENVSQTREHLAQALALRQRLIESDGDEIERDDLGKLYLKLAKNYSGWFHRDDKLALEYTQKARAIYQELYDTTGKTSYLTQLAAIYANLAKLDDDSECHEQRKDDETAILPQEEWFQKQLRTLETVLQLENTILHRQLLAAAYLNYVQVWFIQERPDSFAYCQKAEGLYRSIVRERGTVDDLRNLSQALYAAYQYFPENEKNPAGMHALLEEAISIRQDLYEKLQTPADKDFLATLYHSRSFIWEDPAQRDADQEKAKSLGYVYKGKVYSEVLEILRHMDKEYVNLIPKDVVLFLYDQCDLEYDFRMTKSIIEQEFSPYTLVILRTLVEGFWKNENFTLGDVRLNKIFGKIN